MDEDTSKMILRTVYLPRSLDDQVKLMAFERGVSKGSLIRGACQKLVEEMRGR